MSGERVSGERKGREWGVERLVSGEIVGSEREGREKGVSGK